MFRKHCSNERLTARIWTPPRCPPAIGHYCPAAATDNAANGVGPMVVDAGQFLAGSVLPATIACPPRRVAGHPQGRNEVEEPRLRGLTRHPPRWLSSRRVPRKGLGRRASPQAPRAGEDDEAWRRIDCSRISGLCVETPVSGPPWKSHTAGHTWCRRRAPGLLSAWCGVGRFEAPCRSLTQQLQWSVAHAAKATSRVQTAHTIRASLLATASVALL